MYSTTQVAPVGQTASLSAPQPWALEVAVLAWEAAREARIGSASLQTWPGTVPCPSLSLQAAITTRTAAGAKVEEGPAAGLPEAAQALLGLLCSQEALWSLDGAARAFVGSGRL